MNLKKRTPTEMAGYFGERLAEKAIKIQDLKAQLTQSQEREKQAIIFLKMIRDGNVIPPDLPDFIKHLEKPSSEGEG